MPPLVSICCVTYNHAGTVAQALDSFLAQRADVDVEILIHDDASTDGTDAIIRSYAAAYPDVIKPLFETENQYQKGLAMDATFNFPRATGKYIALCEGDDYFCDPHKLKAQVVAMEARPHITFCFTNGYVRDASGGGADRPFIPFYPQEAAFYTPQPQELDVAGVARLTFIPTASFLFPRALLTPEAMTLLQNPCPNGDLRMKLLLTGLGRALYVHADTCVYRFNAASSAMARWGAEPASKTRARCRQTLAMLTDVDAYLGKREHPVFERLADAQYRVLLEAAPTLALLRQPEARRAFRALPLWRRLKCCVKAALPESVFRRFKALLRRS